MFFLPIFLANIINSISFYNYLIGRREVFVGCIVDQAQEKLTLIDIMKIDQSAIDVL